MDLIFKNLKILFFFKMKKYFFCFLFISTLKSYQNHSINCTQNIDCSTDKSQLVVSSSFNCSCNDQINNEACQKLEVHLSIQYNKLSIYGMGKISQEFKEKTLYFNIIINPDDFKNEKVIKITWLNTSSPLFKFSNEINLTLSTSCKLIKLIKTTQNEESSFKLTIITGVIVILLTFFGLSLFLYIYYRKKRKRMQLEQQMRTQQDKNVIFKKAPIQNIMTQTETDESSVQINIFKNNKLKRVSQKPQNPVLLSTVSKNNRLSATTTNFTTQDSRFTSLNEDITARTNLSSITQLQSDW